MKIQKGNTPRRVEIHITKIWHRSPLKSYIDYNVTIIRGTIQSFGKGWYGATQDTRYGTIPLGTSQNHFFSIHSYDSFSQFCNLENIYDAIISFNTSNSHTLTGES